MKKFLIFIIFVLLLLTVKCVQAQTQAQAEVEFYFFYSDTCGYCVQAKPFVADLEKTRDWLEVKRYEVYYNMANSLVFDEFLLAYGHNPQTAGVPAFFIGDDVLMGFNKGVASQLEQKIDSCHISGCVSPLVRAQQGMSPAGVNNQANQRLGVWVWLVTLVVLGMVGWGIFWIVKKLIKKFKHTE